MSTLCRRLQCGKTLITREISKSFMLTIIVWLSVVYSCVWNFADDYYLSKIILITGDCRQLLWWQSDYGTLSCQITQRISLSHGHPSDCQTIVNPLISLMVRSITVTNWGQSQLQTCVNWGLSQLQTGANEQWDPLFITCVLWKSVAECPKEKVKFLENRKWKQKWQTTAILVNMQVLFLQANVGGCGVCRTFQQCF